MIHTTEIKEKMLVQFHFFRMKTSQKRCPSDKVNSYIGPNIGDLFNIKRKNDKREKSENR